MDTQTLERIARSILARCPLLSRECAIMQLCAVFGIAYDTASSLYSTITCEA